ncbi:helix-turn-helix domain-containing protein [Streptomyces aurantiacus]|uniref:Putative HTH-type transcriptional regulator CdhR n=1 Tax=Streptomyces aurantiacus JA 4570 TaxID=1286094 RepID=S4AQ94_9ACTN|nr:helix-turn-helix domain-containing protein [Streptomyces aurantiacus]EPH43632.1 putative HTH-type transcriptional regulator CdhR [Streptomyces aurantiacus JA 4570]
MSVIALLALDGLPAHQLTTPGLVLDAVARSAPRSAYTLRICAVPRTVTTAEPAPMTITADQGLEGLEGADTVVVPGHQGLGADPPPGVAAALRRAVDRGSRVAAVGTGTFTLAAAGLLDGRRATTVWSHVPELAARHPRVDVDPAGTLVVDGPFRTSAGFLGGLDLYLRLVEEDHGRAAAAATARRLVLPVYDEAGAARDELDRARAGTGGLGPTVRWLEAGLDRPLTLADIAAHARLSVRTLNRRFRAHTGLSPLQYLLRARLDRARHLLEQDADATIEEIAARVGFGSSASFRRHFRHATGMTPRDYRASARPGAGPPEGGPSR